MATFIIKSIISAEGNECERKLYHVFLNNYENVLENSRDINDFANVITSTFF